MARTDKAPVALPLLSRLIPSVGNTGNLIAANTLVRGVYRLFQSDKGNWQSTCLLLSTDTTLNPGQVIERYGLRWSIELMFHQLKQAWGLKEAWQQTRQTLHRWVPITMVGYGLVQLLSYLNSAAVEELCRYSPWRQGNPITAEQIRTGLVRIFRHVRVRGCWNGTCKKIRAPGWGRKQRV